MTELFCQGCESVIDVDTCIARCPVHTQMLSASAQARERRFNLLRDSITWRVKMCYIRNLSIGGLLYKLRVNHAAGKLRFVRTVRIWAQEACYMTELTFPCIAGVEAGNCTA